MEVRASGKLTMADYTLFIPELESLIRRHGKIDLLFEMTDFHGWEPRAMWEDAKFDLRHFSDIGRLAVVGERHWEQMITQLARPFTKATIRYFDHAEAGEARAWLGAEEDQMPG